MACVEFYSGGVFVLMLKKVHKGGWRSVLHIECKFLFWLLYTAVPGEFGEMLLQLYLSWLERCDSCSNCFVVGLAQQYSVSVTGALTRKSAGSWFLHCVCFDFTYFSEDVRNWLLLKGVMLGIIICSSCIDKLSGTVEN